MKRIADEKRFCENPSPAEQTNHVRGRWPPDSQKPSAFARGILAAFGVSEITTRDYGHSQFFLQDDDVFDHCFGVKGDA